MTIPAEPQRPALRPLSLGVALLPVLALFGAIGVSMATIGTGGDALLLTILAAACVATFVARWAGASWAEVQAETGRQIADALPAILILLMIGTLIGSWMFSGTIPLLVILGIDLIDPHYMALTAFVATAVMSVVSGTSWGSAGTIGVALMGAAAALQIPLAPVAGAVVCGAYFGDKLSPLSDMTNIVTIGAGAELYSVVRHMLWTSIPAAIIALIVFAGLGLFADPVPATSVAQTAMLRDTLGGIFRIGPVAAAPLLVALGGIALRKPPVLVLAASALLALAIGVLHQGFAPAQAIASAVRGFDSTGILPGSQLPDSVSNLLDRGGMMAMSGTLLFIIAAFLLAGAMRASGALDRLIAALLAAVRSVASLIAATMAAGALMVAMTSHGGVTALIVGGLFRKSYADRDLAPEALSRTMGDSITVTEPLMPWTVSAVFMASTLGVATLDYAPWAIFCWLSPVMSLVAGVWMGRSKLIS